MNQNELELLEALEEEIDKIMKRPALRIDHDTSISAIYEGREKSIFAEIAGHHLLDTKTQGPVRVEHPYIENALNQHNAKEGDLVYIRARGTNEVNGKLFPKLEVIVVKRPDHLSITGDEKR